MEFKSLEEAYDFMCVSKPGSDLRLDAALYLVKNMDAAMKDKLMRRFPPAPPSVEPAFYDDKGKPYYNLQHILDSMKLTEKERARIVEMFREKDGFFVKSDGELHRRQ
jgi:hypothetical protein